MGATGQHFSEAELACKGTKCGPSGTGCHVNACTQGLVDALEAFRALVAKSVIVDDAYRCPAHNGTTPNAVNASKHVQGEAADIRVEGMTAAELEAMARKIPGIRGIGRDDKRDYIHVDVRSAPTLAQWCYSDSGAQCTYYPPKEQVA